MQKPLTYVLFLGQSPKAIETKIHKRGLIKFKAFCTAKETIKKKKKDNLQNGRIYWIPLLYSRDWRNTVNQLHFNKEIINWKMQASTSASYHIQKKLIWVQITKLKCKIYNNKAPSKDTEGCLLDLRDGQELTSACLSFVIWPLPILVAARGTLVLWRRIEPRSLHWEPEGSPKN